MAKSRRGPAPVPGKPVIIRIESCPEDGKAIVRFLGSYFGTFCHFAGKGKRPIPCMGEECPASLHKGRKMWKGYAPAQYYRGGEFDDWCPCVWEVTESLNETLDGLHLRGGVWEIARVPGPTGKPEVGGSYLYEVEEKDLLPAFDVFPLVHRLYGFLDMQWGVKSHIPKRLRLEPQKGHSPPVAADGVPTVNRGPQKRTAEEEAKFQAALEEGRRFMKGYAQPTGVPVNGHQHTNGKAVLS